jgi:hypothetical protein
MKKARGRREAERNKRTDKAGQTERRTFDVIVGGELDRRADTDTESRAVCAAIQTTKAFGSVGLHQAEREQEKREHG